MFLNAYQYQYKTNNTYKHNARHRRAECTHKPNERIGQMEQLAQEADHEQRSDQRHRIAVCRERTVRQTVPVQFDAREIVLVGLLAERRPGGNEVHHQQQNENGTPVVGPFLAQHAHATDGHDRIEELQKAILLDLLLDDVHGGATLLAVQVVGALVLQI